MTNKTTLKRLKLDPYFSKTIETNLNVWSHDQNSYEIKFEFYDHQCDKPIDLTGADMRILLDHQGSQPKIYPLEIESKVLGLAKFIMPEQIRGCEGKFTAHIYADYPNKTHDFGSFTFYTQLSRIDGDLGGCMDEVYVSEFEKALEKFKELENKIEQEGVLTQAELKKRTYTKAQIDQKIDDIESINIIEKASWDAYNNPGAYEINYNNQKIIFKENVNLYTANDFLPNAIAKGSEVDISIILNSLVQLWFLVYDKSKKKVLFVQTHEIDKYNNKNFLFITLLNYFVTEKSKYIQFAEDIPHNQIMNKPATKLLPAVNGRFVVDKANSSLVFKSDGWDVVALGDKKNFTNLFKNGTELKIPTQKEIASSAINVFFNKEDGDFVFEPYATPSRFMNDEQYSWFGAIRRTSKADGTLNEFSANIPLPWEIDGKLYGIYDLGNGQTTQSDVYPSVLKTANVRNIHHRGLSKKFPENTLLAYRASKKVGVNEVEMDLNFTKDNVPVNLHDDTINRTARNDDGSKLQETIKIADITLEEAKKYDFGQWKSSKFKGERIPTFEECLVQCKALEQTLHVDVAYKVNDEQARILSSIVDKVNYRNVVYYVLELDTGYKIRNNIADAELSVLIFGDVNDQAIETAEHFNKPEAKCSIIAQADALTIENLNKAKEKDIDVFVWNADNVDRDWLIANGINGISTDYVNTQYETLTK